MKKFILPVAVVLLGTGAALSTQSFKKANSTIVEGYRINQSNPEQECENTHVECSTESGAVCEDAMGNSLREFNGTSCPNLLYKP